jgi:glutathione S-transferase
MQTYPVLYSFRRCPYAMRARLAVNKANIKCELREVILKDKPESMLAISSKGTVPVLLTTEEKVIDQSCEVMHWALNKNDPDNWLDEDASQSQFLIDYNDNEFKHFLDRYKYHVGYPEYSQEYYRENSESFLKLLEEHLGRHQGVALLGDRYSFVDMAIFPFIRQFAMVDLEWFQSSPYDLLKKWFAAIEQGELFQSSMEKYEQWKPGQAPVYFPA